VDVDDARAPQRDVDMWMWEVAARATATAPISRLAMTTTNLWVNDVESASFSYSYS